MFRSIRTLYGCRIVGADGPIGGLRDLLFDDKSWAVRYLVVDTGTGLAPGRNVLVPCAALEQPDWQVLSLSVAITRRDVETFPHMDVVKRIRREYEAELHRHYGCDFYWEAEAEEPQALHSESRSVGDGQQQSSNEANEDSAHLLRAGGIIGYSVEARDGGIGHVTDIVIDVNEWAVGHVVLAVGRWLRRRAVLVSPKHIEEVDSGDLRIRVDLPRDLIWGLRPRRR